MKCAYCEYSVQTKETSLPEETVHYKCAYNGDSREKTTYCDKALIMWEYNNMGGES